MHFCVFGHGWGEMGVNSPQTYTHSLTHLSIIFDFDEWFRICALVCKHFAMKTSKVYFSPTQKSRNIKGCHSHSQCTRDSRLYRLPVVARQTARAFHRRKHTAPSRGVWMGRGTAREWATLCKCVIKLQIQPFVSDAFFGAKTRTTHFTELRHRHSYNNYDSANNKFKWIVIITKWKVILQKFRCKPKGKMGWREMETESERREKQFSKCVKSSAIEAIYLFILGTFMRCSVMKRPINL